MSSDNSIDFVMQLYLVDMETIVEALENYKSKEFAGEIMKMMTSGLLKKSKDLMTDAELQAESVRERQEEEELKRKEEAQKRFRREVDVLKSKIVLLVEARRMQEAKQLAPAGGSNE